MFSYRGITKSSMFRQKNVRAILVPMRLGVTPVPIPNTMVKTQAADDTALETMWESRWVPGIKKENWSLPVIRVLKRFKVLMTDKNSVRYVP